MNQHGLTVFVQPIVTIFFFLFVSRGRRQWTRFCTQSASPTVWRSSPWRTQDSNRRFPLSLLTVKPSVVKTNLASYSSPHTTTFQTPPLFSCPASIYLISPFHLRSSPAPPSAALTFSVLHPPALTHTHTPTYCNTPHLPPLLTCAHLFTNNQIEHSPVCLWVDLSFIRYNISESFSFT